MSRWKYSVSASGPRLFGFRRGDTDYRFSLILFGGYVKMAGEQPGEHGTAGRSRDGLTPRHKPRWQRLIIAAAGPFMNVVLAIAVLTGLFMVSYEKILERGRRRDRPHDAGFAGRQSRHSGRATRSSA